MFIVIEGVDGVGKTSVVKGLSIALKKFSDRIEYMSFPSKSPTGLIARQAIKDNKSKYVVGHYMIGDIASYKHRILNLLTNGKIVISDRYIASFMAYQGAMLGKKYVDEQMEKFKKNILAPTVTFVLYADKDLIKNRIESRGDTGCSIEKMGIDFLMKVQEQYSYMPIRNMRYIDVSNMNIEKIIDRIADIIDKILLSRISSITNKSKSK